MKIFVLYETQEDEIAILGVFDTYEKAQEALEECENQYNWEYTIEEFTLNNW